MTVVRSIERSKQSADSGNDRAADDDDGNRLIRFKRNGRQSVPFEHAQTNTTLRAHALTTDHEELDMTGLVEATEQMPSRLTRSAATGC